MAATKASTAKSRSAKSSANVWTDEERAAMQESARERKTASKRDPAAERAEGEVAPSLVPRTYYGMPAYAKDGKVICFFQGKSKFKVRYSTLGFQPEARIDDGEMWPVAFAVTELTSASEKRIAELVKKAIG